MHRLKLLAFVVILGIIPQFAFSKAPVITTQKQDFGQKKQHPMEQHLSSIKKDSQKASEQKRSRANYEKLLIILVGFQEEIIDDPLTTGNGQFQLEVPDYYTFNISKPPHNQEYYDKMALAMKYYYSASSLGGFELDWDIYPQDKPCYTLPHSMAYYNPDGVGSSQFVSKMEEYFKESFETADRESPEIVFSDYAHYMIIHAGSDWQHDVMSDTPCDIPSFFIRVAEGKEAIVDNGEFMIDHACNVPETITQDIREVTYGGETQISGYGALNGVMFHEFGHSLGLVDLYAVNSHYPMVGSFDIMDSGGSSEVLILDPSNNYLYSVEGLIPGLPGAFSRVLMFEDNFRARGILKDIESLDDLTDIPITCAETRFSESFPTYIYKLQLSPTEYILIENRNVDPDGDGGTSYAPALDGRIALYPTPYYDDNNTPTLEYDYLLPSFFSQELGAVGGGLLVWKVNEDVLYNQGHYTDQGEFVSNFENNYVNTHINRRGVEIIEADAIPDIGNVYAYWWRGTAFEYYFKNKPVLEEISGNQYFVEWGNEIHNTELNATSLPPLTDSSDIPTSSGLYNVSESGSIMRFSYGSPILNHTAAIASEREILAVSPILNTTTKLPEIALIYANSIDFYYNNPSDSSFNDNQTVNTDVNEVSFPVMKCDLDNDSNDELIYFSENRINIIKHDQHYFQEFDDLIKFRPILFNKSFYVPLMNSLLKVDFDIQTAHIRAIKYEIRAEKLIASEDRIFALDSGNIIDIEANSYSPLPEPISKYEPLLLNYIEQDSNSAKLSLIFMTDNHRLYQFENNSFSLIYDYSNKLDAACTNPAINYDEQAPYVLFASGTKLYANYLDGTQLLNFPRDLHNYNFTPGKDLMIIDNAYLNDKVKNDAENEEIPIYGKTIYLPLENDNYLAYSISHNKIDKSLNLVNSALASFFSISDLADNNNHLYQVNHYQNSAIIQWSNKLFNQEAILWEVTNNNQNRCFTYHHKSDPSAETSGKLSAYIFPNPVAKSDATIRVFNIKDSCNLKIYNIAGKLVNEQTIETNNLEYVDTILDTSKMSSGVYIGVLKEEITTRFKFAVVK